MTDRARGRRRDRAAHLLALQGAEHDDLVAFLRELPPPRWDAPTLCAGWAVRHVVAHLVGWDDLLVGGSWTRLALAYGRAGMSTDRLNERLVRGASSASPEQLLRRIDRPGVGTAPRTFDRLAPGAQLAEYVVHQQDIRRPLGSGRTVPPDRLVAALDGVARLPALGVRRRARRLRLEATDVDWTAGRPGGPDVRGPGEALLLALAGRAAVLDELTGSGVGALRAD